MWSSVANSTVSRSRCFVGEQFGSGVHGPPGPVQRVARAAAVAVDGLLDARRQVSMASPARSTTGAHNGDLGTMPFMPRSCLCRCRQAPGWSGL